MNLFKRTLCIVMMLAMLCSMIPCASVSAEELEENGSAAVEETAAAETETVIAEELQETVAEETQPVMESIDIVEEDAVISAENFDCTEVAEALEDITHETLPDVTETATVTDDVMAASYPGSVVETVYPTCAMSELTTVDYMAFSELAYLDFDLYAYAFESNFDSVGSYKTVKQALMAMGKWNSNWSSKQGIKYSELCANIENWQVLTYYNHSNSNGFYGVAFKNNDNEVVISYRGSVPFDEFNESNGWDWIQDWLVNDLPVVIFNLVLDSKQYQHAFEMYGKIAAGGRTASQICATGHSLGGGLGNLVAARYGCDAQTINAASLLDAVFYALPVVMGETYKGIETWGFRDHANEDDYLAGMYEDKLSTKIKPYYAYKSNDKNLGIGGSHSMKSLVQKVGETVKMTEKTSEFRVLGWKTSKLALGTKHVNFGSSSKDEISYGFLDISNRAAFGGNGADYITTSDWDDTIVGGKGNDELHGGSGDDTYIYYKGNGADTIYDSDGSDELWLYNFSKGDGIIVDVDADNDFVLVQQNNSTIVKIAKKGRKFLANDTFKVIIEDTDGTTDSTDITGAFKNKKYWQKLTVACPVYIEILDADGNVVYTVEDGVVGSHITDYGNFYVYQEEDGSGYGKSIELVEGYTARIVGHDEGTMEVSSQVITEEGLSEAVTTQDIPVTDTFVATVEENDEGEAVLVMDTNGDGDADQKVTVGNVLTVPMHRMYDPNSGEHFYTGSEVERDFLVSAGWHYEGVGFNFPVEGKPVYRLYEPTHGEHLYTMDEAEKAKLISWGWNDEGVAFNSAGEDEVPQYRLHNPNAKRGGYHFTGSEEERDLLISVGWINEGIGWYSCAE